MRPADESQILVVQLSDRLLFDIGTAHSDSSPTCDARDALASAGRQNLGTGLEHIKAVVWKDSRAPQHWINRSLFAGLAGAGPRAIDRFQFEEFIPLSRSGSSQLV